MSTRFVKMLLTCGVLLAVALPASASAQETKELTVPGELVFHHGARADDPGNCSATPFVQWADVPNTVSATIFWTNVTRGEMSETKAPPFDDIYEWVIPYFAPGGMHWIALGTSWVDGPRPNDCSELSARQRASNGPPARVELTIEIDEKKCKRLRSKLAANKTGLRRAKSILSELTRKDKAKYRGWKQRVARHEQRIERLKKLIAAQC